MPYCRVALRGRPLALTWKGDAEPGDLVDVPLTPRGSGGKPVIMRGVVIDHTPPDPAWADRVKAIISVRKGLPKPVMDLAMWASTYYRCSIADLLDAAVPPPVWDNTQEATVGWVIPLDEPRDESDRTIWSSLPPDGISMQTLIQEKVLTRSVITKWVKAGWLKREDRPVDRMASYPIASRPGDMADPNPEQRSAIDAIRSASGFKPFLLFGITGSGKTLVYIRAIQDRLQQGGQALILVPEIALTPQLASRFKAFFPDTVVWHSGLTDGQRAEAFRKVQSGEARIVLGARSALWAPLADVRLIVVDEEHDGSYGSDRYPYIHARDLAVVRAKQAGCPIIMGSGTPTLASMRQAMDPASGWSMLTLMQRPAGATLPVVRIVDMRHERSIDNRPIDLSRPLIEGLTYRKSVGEQAVILLNRRGWGSATGCACGYTAQCPSCVIPLTAHKTGKVLKCHRCGYEEPWNHCPWCGKEIAAIGLGTQRLASMVERLVPGIRVGRLDADTGAGVKAQRIIAAFAAGDIDVLIGTQMIAKGLDIPNVTMAAMIRADASLDEESTHSWERAWSLMIQVSGRAGRSSRPGEVIIQTIAPDHPAIVSAKTCDYQLFYKADAQRRKAMRRAPFFHECVIRISTRHEPTSHLLVSKVHGMGDLVSDGVWGGEHRFSAWASFATRHERTAWMDRWMAWYQKQSDAFKRVVRCTPHVDPRD